jgi:jumonji domain-containing protein 7
VIRGQGFRDQVPALDRWADDYLVEKMEEREVDISIDPTG